MFQWGKHIVNLQNIHIYSLKTSLIQYVSNIAHKLFRHRFPLKDVGSEGEGCLSDTVYFSLMELKVSKVLTNARCKSLLHAIKCTNTLYMVLCTHNTFTFMQTLLSKAAYIAFSLCNQTHDLGTTLYS